MKKIGFKKSFTSTLLALFILALFPLMAQAAAPQMNVNIVENQRATYGAVVLDASPPAAATDLLEVRAPTGYKVRIKKIFLSGTSTSGGTMDVALWKRSAADTSGTYTAVTGVRYDSATDASPQNAVIRLYSDTTVVAGAGYKIAGSKMNFGAAGSAGTVNWDFANRNTKPIILHPGQSLAVNFGGASITAGARLSATVEWEEETD